MRWITDNPRTPKFSDVWRAQFWLMLVSGHLFLLRPSLCMAMRHANKLVIPEIPKACTGPISSPELCQKATS